MEPEEAAEVILRGDKYVSCPVCDDAKRRGFRGRTDCPLCKGFGYLLNPVYVEARRVVGLRPPPTPPQLLLERLCRLEERMKESDGLED
jgi:hypothetical protein